MLISKKFTFDSSHHLPDYNGKCEEVHGHTYRLIVTLEGEPQKDGLILDFAEIKRIVTREILDKIDHKDLNKIIKIPSAEHIAIFIYDRLKDKFPPRVKLCEVKLWETGSSSVTYKGNM